MNMINSLHETVNMMCSNDAKLRLKAEYWQLRVRHKKLKDKIHEEGLDGKIKFTDLIKNKDNKERNLMFEQMATMEQYIKVLTRRAELMGVDLDA